MKKVLVMIVISTLLIISGCSTNSDKSDKYAGKINGELIEKGVYTSSFLNNYNRLMKSKGQNEPTVDDINQLNKITWNGLAQSAIIKQYLIENQITVSKQEVLDSLLATPPADYIANGKFDVDNVFDEKIYRASIQYDKPVNTSKIKNFYYNSYLPVQKMRHKLAENASIDKSAVKKYYKKNYGAAHVTMLGMDLDSYDPTVTNKEVELRYNSNNREYFYTPNLSIKYLSKIVEPKKSDISRAKITVDSLYAQIKTGLDFTVAVRKFSSSVKTYQNGMMPFITLEKLPELIKTQIKNNGAGAVIRPVSKNNVWYIYKILEKTKSMVKLQEIKYPVQLDHSTILGARERLSRVGELIAQIGIEQAASEYDYTVHTADSLNFEHDFVVGLGNLSSLIKESITKKDGFIFKPIYNKSERLLVMVQIIENHLNKKRPFAELSESIFAEIKKEKRKKLVGQKLQSLVDNDEYIELINSSEIDVEMFDLDNITFKSVIERDVDNRMKTKILKLNERGTFSDPIVIGDKVYIAILKEKTKADISYLNKNFYIIQGEYREEFVKNYYDTWIEEQVKNASISRWFDMADFFKKGK